MKKFAKLALIVTIVAVALVGVLAACNDYEWDPVGTTDPDGAVSGNGTLAVAQGNTVYFVNGKADVSTITEAEQNTFGNAGYKGNIMKGTLKEDGTVADVAVVAPKMFYNGQAEGGLYVFGEWLYYTSPSTDTRSDGTVLTSQQDFFRVKTDGTSTQKIVTLASNAYEYIFTEGGLFYFDTSKSQIIKIAYTDEEIGESSVIAEGVTDVMFVKDGEYKRGQERVSDMFFYTKAGDTENNADVLYGNRVFACNYAGKSVTLIDNTTFVPQGAIAAQYQYTVTLLDVTVESTGVALYYSRTPGSSAVSGASTATAAYLVTPAAISEGAEGAVLVAAQEKVLANSALSSVTAVSYAFGVLQADSNNALVRYYNDGVAKKAYLSVDEKGEPAALEGTPTILSVADEAANTTNNNVAGKYMYYTVSNALYKFNLDTGKALGKVLDSTQDTVYADYISASFITRTVGEKTVTYLFYINGITGNYTSVAPLSSLNYAQAGSEWMLSGVVASGYWSTDDESCTDENYAYDANSELYTVTDAEDSTATVQISKPLPKFMEDGDKATYISAYGA